MRQLSATKLQTYRRCPRQYNYTYLKKYVEGVQNIYAIHGYVVHKVIELYYTQADERNTLGHVFDPLIIYQRLMTEKIAEIRRTGEQIAYLEQTGNLYVSAIDIFNSFDWQRAADGWSEIEFTLPYPNAAQPICLMHGFIDRVFPRIEPKELADWKTSKQAPKPKELAANIQFQLYAWAFQQLYGTSPEHVYWVHLRTGEWIETAVQGADEEITHLVEMVLADTTYPPLAWGTSVCRFCPFFGNRCTGSLDDDTEEPINGSTTP